MPGYPFNIFYSDQGSDYVVPAAEIIAGASNIKAGDNPAFAASDFLGIYPEFKTTTIPAEGDPPTEGLNVPDAVFDMILAEANAKIIQRRWHSQWTRGMCNYIAHYITLYLKASSGSNPMLINTSKSVGDVSASYDASAIMQDLQGYGDLKSTTYGVQLATAARLVGKGGMGIW
jgi:hypothetical protein